MGEDLQWVVDEFARIEHEFERAVSFTVIRDSGFEELDTLKVRFRLVESVIFRGLIDSFTFVTRRSFSVTVVEMGFTDTLLVCRSQLAILWR